MPSRLSTLLIAAMLTVLTVDATALEIRVRGDSKMVTDVTAAGTMAQVSGVLTDDLDRPLPQREVTIFLDSVSGGERLVDTTILTGARGDFRFHEEFPPGDYVVSAVFSPSSNFEGSSTTDTVELRPAPFDLRIVAPDWVSAGAERPIVIYGQARSGSVGVQGTAIVSVNGQRVGEMTLEPSGRGSFDLSGIVTPGENRITVTIPGSRHRDPATAETMMRVSGTIDFQARIENRVERLSRGVAIYGTVTDEVGPIEGARIQATLRPVGIEPEDDVEVPARIDVTATTDDDGEFVAFFDASKLVDGKWVGNALLAPPVGDTMTVDAGEVERNTALQRAIFDVLGLLVVLLGALALAGGLLDRARQALIRARLERARREEERAALQAEEKIVPVFLDAREAPIDGPRPTSKTIAGMVWDVWQGSPVADAEVVLTARDGRERATTSDERGCFRFDELDDGVWNLVARADGFIRGTMQLSVPHDGRLGRFRLDLVAVPLKVRRLYQSVVARDHRGAEYWGRLSPSEIERELSEAFGADRNEALDELRGRVLALLDGKEEEFDASEVLGALTRLLEESYWSGRTFDEQVFFAARDLALRLRSLAARALVLLAFGLAASSLPRPVSAQPLADYDPNNTDWSGLSDFVALGDALGAPFELSDTLDWDEMDTTDPIILVYPSQEIDVASFSRFVVEGGRVVIADDFGRSENLLERLEITRVAPSPGNLPHETYVDGNSGLPLLAPRGRHPLLPGVNTIVANHPSVISNIGGPVVAYEGGGGFIYDMNLGRGKVIVVSDASVFINQMLGAGDNTALARNVITYACTDPLLCKPRLFTKVFSEEGQFGISASDAEVSDGVEAFNDALDDLLDDLPARELLYWISLLLAVGLGAYLVTVFPLKRTRRYSAYVTDFIDAIPTPQGEFDWNLSRFGEGSRTMNYALPMAILKEHFEELFLGAFDLWPSKAADRPGVERLAQMYVSRFASGASHSEQERMEREAVELLATFARLPPRTRVFLEDDARFRDVDMLTCHRRAMAILERMGLKDEYERRTRRTAT